MATLRVSEETQAMLDKIVDKKFKLPKTLAECGDLAYQLRQERYELQRAAKALDAKESALESHLINNLPASEATGVRGKVAMAKIEEKELAIVVDWDAVYEYIIKRQKKEPGVWSLLQRRINEAPVKEMWAKGKKMPGCEKKLVKVVSLTKV